MRIINYMNYSTIFFILHFFASIVLMIYLIYDFSEYNHMIMIHNTYQIVTNALCVFELKKEYRILLIHQIFEGLLIPLIELNNVYTWFCVCNVITNIGILMHMHFDINNEEDKHMYLILQT